MGAIMTTTYSPKDRVVFDAAWAAICRSDDVGASLLRTFVKTRGINLAEALGLPEPPPPTPPAAAPQPPALPRPGPLPSAVRRPPEALPMLSHRRGPPHYAPSFFAEFRRTYSRAEMRDLAAELIADFGSKLKHFELELCKSFAERSLGWQPTEKQINTLAIIAYEAPRRARGAA